jgi:hypothetical protein
MLDGTSVASLADAAYGDDSRRGQRMVTKENVRHEEDHQCHVIIIPLHVQCLFKTFNFGISDICTGRWLDTCA